MNWQKDNYLISTEPELLDFQVILRFISEESYWGKGRSAETMQKALNHSTFCFGLYHIQNSKSSMIGFARVISDLTVFAYLSDVFVLSEYRGHGLGRWLVGTVCEHPEIKNLKNICLITRTPDFYEPLSFETLDPTGIRKFMMRKPPSQH